MPVRFAFQEAVFANGNKADHTGEIAPQMCKEQDCPLTKPIFKKEHCE